MITVRQPEDIYKAYGEIVNGTFSDAEVYSCFLQKDKIVNHTLQMSHGGYLYVLEGGPVKLNGKLIPHLGAAKITDEKQFVLTAINDTELLFVDTLK